MELGGEGEKGRIKTILPFNLPLIGAIFSAQRVFVALSSQVSHMVQFRLLRLDLANRTLVTTPP